MSLTKNLIETLALQPHVEGGHYCETHRSSQSVVTLTGERTAGTSILYLLAGSEVSRFHRIDADEIWFHHQGGPLIIYSLHEKGETRADRLSADNPQVIIPAGVWFGAALENPDDYCLSGCAVSPGFDFAGFELADRTMLLKGWPDASDWIERLT